MFYWHGGQPGLTVGAVLLPPDQTGVITLGAVLAERCPWLAEATGRARDRTDRVYIADTQVVPVIAAAMWTLTPWCDGDGAVYLVRPCGELEPDLAKNLPGRVGAFDGSCWMCERAVIRAVVYPALGREYVMAEVPGAARAAGLLRAVAEGRPPPATGWHAMRHRIRQQAAGP